MNPRTKKICDKCNKEISISNFNKHYNKCGVKKEKIKKEKIYVKCPYCEKKSKNIKYHIWAIHTEEGKNWHPNKGKTSKLKGRKNVYTHTEDAKQKISKNNQGWKYVGSGGRYCKWHPVLKKDGSIVKVQGTYEKRFAEVLNIIDPDWIKPISGKQNLHLMWVDDIGKKHSYFPDFWCPNLKKYFEVKGRYDEPDIQKMKYILSHYNNIEMIFLEDIKKYEKFYLK